MALTDWPNLQDYAFSLQDPARCFKDKELRQSTIRKNAHGQPASMAGQFAVVYKATLANGKHQAVRAFTSNRPEMTARYKAINDHLKSFRIDSLVNFKYHEKGIKTVNKAGQLKSYPLVIMDWVEGEELYAWVRDRCLKGENKKLESAAERWFQLKQDLTQAEIAHGDLQHANIMVDPSGALKLVDYDCMCVPVLVDEINLEIGVVPYQHPDRNGDTRLSLELDNFSAIFIFVVLRALAASPKLWNEFVEPIDYDKLLIRREDFTSPDESDLYQALCRSPDQEVRRMSKDLFELYQTDIDKIPRLESVLFSYDRVRSAICTRDFDLAIQLLNRRNNGKDVPANLKKPIANARDRVRCRKELEERVKAGDELGMQKSYEPHLLDDYPQARPAVKVAKDAPAVLSILQELKITEQKKQWHDLVKVWDHHRPLLETRKSATAWMPKIDRWRQRNQFCTDVLKLRKQPKPDIARLQQLWEQLKRLGGHPDTEAQKNEIEQFIRRESAWAPFASAMTHTTPSEQNDRKLTDAWKESIFKGWTKAEQHRERYTLAGGRLSVIDKILNQAAKTTSAAGEKVIVDLAKRISRGYQHSLQERITQAVQRLKYHAHVMSKLEAPVSDTAVFKAYQKLKLIQGQELLNAQQQTRMQLAGRRVPLIEQLQQIPANLPAYQYDQQILTCWQDALLRDCHDAKPWRLKLELAQRRTVVLTKLRAAIAADDKPEIVQLSSDKCFDNYQFTRDLQPSVDRAKQGLRAAQSMINALKNGKRKAFRAAFDAPSLRNFHEMFKPYRERLIECVRSEILSPEKLGLKKERGTKPIVADGRAGVYYLKWSFPDSCYSNECVVTITKVKPAPTADFSTIKPVFAQPVTRQNYERGGLWRVNTEREWKHYYLAVWAVVDLVSEQLTSSPLVLGEIGKS